MTRLLVRLSPCLLLAILMLATAPTECANGAVLARYRLGEDDVGASAGGPGNNPTTGAPGANLARLGSPTYSANASPGGSTLSMNFPGNGGAGDATDSFYYGAAPTTDLTNNFTYSFDANVSANPSSFAFLASLGSNFGGIAVLQGGSTINLFFPGAGPGTGPGFTPVIGEWNRYEVSYAYNGGGGAEVTTLSVNGNVVGTRNGPPSNSQVINALTLGGNFRLNAPAAAATRTLGDFEGAFNGLIDNFVFDGVAPPSFPSLTVDRTTGGITLTNATGAPYQFIGYRIVSGVQALDAARWKSIAANYDAGSPGPNQVDPDDNWTALSPNPNFTLSEFESEGDNGVTLANGRSVDLGSGNGAATFGPWIKNPTEDVSIELLRPDGTIATVAATFQGNGGVPFRRSDLNFDGAITAADWQIFKAGIDKSFAGVQRVRAYQMGDLNGDLISDVDDFGLFKADFIGANGDGAFAALFSVPEPSSSVLMGMVLLAFARLRIRFSSSSTICRSKKPMLRYVFPCRCSAPFGLTYAHAAVGALVAFALVAIGGDAVRAGFQTVAQYNLGENDPGAANGAVGKDPSNAVVGPNLVRLGSPTNSSDVPVGGSTLSMTFAGNGGAGDGTDSLYYTTAPARDVTQRIVYSFDAKLLTPSPDFAFVASLGSNWGALSVVEFAGSVQLFFPGAGGGTGTFNVNDGNWHRYVVDYTPNGGGGAEVTTLSVDGNVVSTRNGPTANGQISNAFTIGGNFRGASVDDAPVLGAATINLFEGAFNGRIDNVVVQTFTQPLLTLEVNKTTGATKLKNASGESIDFDYYTIRSAGGALVPGGLAADFDSDGDADGSDFLRWQRGFGTASGAVKSQGDANADGAVNGADFTVWNGQLGQGGSAAGWNSLQDQNLAGFPAGNGTGNGWEESPNASANVLTEAFLANSSSMATATEVSLGRAFNPSIFGAGVDGDLTFQFRTNTGSVFDGVITYVTGGAAAAVPEPAALGLVLAAGGVVAARRRPRRSPWRSREAAHRRVTLALAVGFVVANVATCRASFTLDRKYRLGEGDNDSGSPSAGAPVGSTTSTGDTYDEQGTPGTNTLNDLKPSGGPTYANVAGRPLALGSTLGVSFDGVNDFLTGFRLGLPDTTVASTNSTQVNPDAQATTIVGTLPYNGLSNRGFQFWVNPTDGRLGNGQTQAVVLDSNQHGVAISGAGTWVIRYGGNQFDTGVAVKRDSATDGSAGWSHVMLVRPNGAASGAWLYVDGQGIGAQGGGYDGGDANYLTVGASTGNRADADPGNDPGQGEFFAGVVDDLNMFVLGRNNLTPPDDFGTFNFAADNQFAAKNLASAVAGDVNRNGVVNQADVALFAANFDTANRVNGVQLPDLTYRTRGDLNFDGTIDLRDAFLLHSGLAAAGVNLSLEAILAGVPEPTSLMLLATVALPCAGLRRRSAAVAK